MISPETLAGAYGMDLLLGDPEWLPHPVRLIGAEITSGTRCLHPAGAHPAGEFVSGTALSLGVVGSTAVAANCVCRLGSFWETLLAWTCLATRSLQQETSSVLDALDAGDLATARIRLSRIVGRDTESLDESEIARAVIETAAESTCDGIVAPLLFLAFGGVPAALAYKAVNTLDSMIGHREAPYTYFGKFAARMDDVCNFIPARIAAVAITLAARLVGCHSRRSWQVLLQDGSHHASPNAGRMEAAMAGALGVRLGGTNFYDGQPHYGATIHQQGKAPSSADARVALRVVAVASGLVFGALFGLALWMRRDGDTNR